MKSGERPDGRTARQGAFRTNIGERQQVDVLRLDVNELTGVHGTRRRWWWNSTPASRGEPNRSR